MGAFWKNEEQKVLSCGKHSSEVWLFQGVATPPLVSGRQCPGWLLGAWIAPARRTYLSHWKGTLGGDDRMQRMKNLNSINTSAICIVTLGSCSSCKEKNWSPICSQLCQLVSEHLGVFYIAHSPFSGLILPWCCLQSHQVHCLPTLGAISVVSWEQK